MKNEARYLVVMYKNAPDIDFVCQCDGKVRLRVCKVEKSRFFDLSKKSLCAIVENCMLVFEEIGCQVAPKEEILKAILWYKRWLGEKHMYILNPTD